MEYLKFKQLIRGGERANVDYKIKCDAFLSRRMAPKAELARDICAMANNGNTSSYILIGVSDDRKSFESVSNLNLTDDKIQDFCKKAIFPPPKIKVHRERWIRVSSSHSGKDFIIIQVGPNARQAFCLARDFIDYHKGICYRRNSVWIRRGATSDLATPEEIARLEKGKHPIEESKPDDYVEYDRLARYKQEKSMLNDFQKCVEEIGGFLYGHRAIIPIMKLRYVWRYILLRECIEKFSIWDNVSREWQYEHGVILLIMKTVSKRAFHEYVEVNFKEKWGWFTYYSLPRSYIPHLWVPLPVNTKAFPLVTLTLPNLANTDILRNSFLNLLRFIETDQDSYNRVRMAREGINRNIRRWLKQGWLFHTNRSYIGNHPKKSELKNNEVLDKRYGNFVLRRDKSEDLIKIAKTVLDLSSGRLT